MSAVLTDGYTPPREPGVDADLIRVMGDGTKESRGALHEYVSQELENPDPMERKEKLTDDFEPYGMYWFKNRSGDIVLRCHEWFIQQIVKNAGDLVGQASEMFSKDTEAQELVEQLTTGLRDYIQTRTAINEMSGARKLNQEMGDAEYQFCQAAKYWIDAQQKAEYALQRGQQLDDVPQIRQLREYANTSLREGYIINQAVIRAADRPPMMKLHPSAQRVAEFSAKKLTEWFAARRKNRAAETKLANVGAAMDLIKFFRR